MANKTLQKIEETQPIQGEAELLISQAIDKKVDVATMEKLLAMRRELREERAQEEYDRAMAKFQSECPIIEKRKQGYNYKYAPLDQIIGQIKDILSNNGFSYAFDTDETERGLVIYCKVKHIGGHSESYKTYIDKESTTKMNASQQSGSIMTYGKRYAFVNAFGILTGDEDNDATTYHSHEKPPQIQIITPQRVEYITKDQLNEIDVILSDKNKSKIELEAFIYDANQAGKLSSSTLEKLTKKEGYALIAKLKNDSGKTTEQEAEVTEADLNKMATLF